MKLEIRIHCDECKAGSVAPPFSLDPQARTAGFAFICRLHAPCPFFPLCKADDYCLDAPGQCVTVKP